MVEEKQSFGFLIRQKSFLFLFFLILNSFSWFYLTTYVIRYAAPELISQLYWLFFLAALVSMLIGPIVAKNFGKMRFLFIWVLLGVISSLLYMVLPTFGRFGIMTLLILLGFAFGIGLPSCFALIPSLTKIEERGRAGGIIFFATYAVLPFLYVIVEYLNDLIVIEHLNIFSISLVLAVWRGLGLGAFLLHADTGKVAQLKPTSYRSILRHKTFLLYLLPWLAFCLINFFETEVFEQHLEMGLMVSAAFIIGCFSCITGGWSMDLKGRRWIIILALVMLGFGYALLSLFPFILPAQVFYVIVDGIALGILTVAFGFVVWGDIANGAQGEKFYAVGLAPIPIAVGLSALVSPQLAKLDPSGAFSIASFFLFLAIIPIFFAPELLPEKVIKERELRKYMEEAKKVARRG